MVKSVTAVTATRLVFLTVTVRPAAIINAAEAAADAPAVRCATVGTATRHVYRIAVEPSVEPAIVPE